MPPGAGVFCRPVAIECFLQLAHTDELDGAMGFSFIVSQIYQNTILIPPGASLRRLLRLATRRRRRSPPARPRDQRPLHRRIGHLGVLFS